MSLLLAQLAFACSVAACTDQSGPSPRPLPEVTLGTPVECGRIIFEFVEGTVVGTYPPRPNCGGSELVLVSFAPMSWAPASRTLTVPVSVLNLSTSTVQLPIRVELPGNGRTVLKPSGQPAGRIKPLNHDSLLAGERWLWLIGGIGTLAPGDSTPSRDLTFTIESPVTRGRIWFVGAGEEVPQVPAMAPNSRPAWFADDTSYSPGGIIKRVVSVIFASGATVPDRQAAIDSIAGEVVGGLRWASGGEGIYYVYLPGASTTTDLRAAITILERQAAVALAEVLVEAVPQGRRPNDASSWQAADWSFSPDSAQGDNWAFEDLALPLAWGCETGTASTKIGIVEPVYRTADYAPNVVGGIPGPADTAANSHGAMTASVIGAVGDNGVAGTGVAWNAELRLEAMAANHPTQADVAAAVDSLIRNGTRVINLSLGARFAVNGIPADDSLAARGWVAHIGWKLDSTPASQRPLLVVAAGNDNRDAFLGGPAGLKDFFPDNVLVVGASTPRTGSARSRWGGANFTSGPLAGSNHGPYLDLYAPGVGVLVPQSGPSPWTGTSVSAPFVTGIAALLFSFDPSLTVKEVRDLVLAGAVAGSRPIQHDAGRYLANAYESLKLAGRKPGRPVCGFPAFLTGPLGNQRIVLARDSAAADTIPLPANPPILGPPGPGRIETYHDLSVGQGGRILSIGFQRYDFGGGFDQTTDEVHEYRVANDVWSRTRTISGLFSRTYLERDTVDVLVGDATTGYGFHTTIRKATGSTVTYPPFDSVLEPSAGGFIEWMSFSMDGSYAVMAGPLSYDCQNRGRYITYLVHLPSAAGQIVGSSVCQMDMFSTSAAWNQASNRFVVPVLSGWTTPSVATTYTAWLIVNGQLQPDGQTSLYPDRAVLSRYDWRVGAGMISPDGDTMYWFEAVAPFTVANCRLVQRSAHSPFGILEETPVQATASGNCASPVINTAPQHAIAGSAGWSMLERGVIGPSARRMRLPAHP